MLAIKSKFLLNWNLRACIYTYSNDEHLSLKAKFLCACFLLSCQCLCKVFYFILKNIKMQLFAANKFEENEVTHSLCKPIDLLFILINCLGKSLKLFKQFNIPAAVLMIKLGVILSNDFIYLFHSTRFKLLISGFWVRNWWADNFLCIYLPYLVLHWRQ